MYMYVLYQTSDNCMYTLHECKCTPLKDTCLCIFNIEPHIYMFIYVLNPNSDTCICMGYTKIQKHVYVLLCQARNIFDDVRTEHVYVSLIPNLR